MKSSDLAIRDMLTAALGDFDNFSLSIGTGRNARFGVEATPLTPQPPAMRPPSFTLTAVRLEYSHI